MTRPDAAPVVYGLVLEAEGARTVALHLLRSRAGADLERQVESELVIGLLESVADAATVAGRLGLAPESLRLIALGARIVAEQPAALLLVFLSPLTPNSAVEFADIPVVKETGPGFAGKPRPASAGKSTRVSGPAARLGEQTRKDNDSRGKRVTTRRTRPVMVAQLMSAARRVSGFQALLIKAGGL